MDHFTFIINSRSGRNKNETLQRFIKDECRVLDMDCSIYITKLASDVKQIVDTDSKKKNTFFIAVGGDGTVNTLAQNLVHKSNAMGIIPRGSGNGLAKHLHLPKDIKGALNRIKRKKIQSIDAIYINDQWSFNVAGIGFDGYISTLFGQDGKRGMRNYMKLIQKEYIQYKPIEMDIEYEGKKTVHHLFQLAVANASQYGNNAYIAPNASLQDQILDIGMVTKVPLALLPAFFLKVFSKNIHRSKYYAGFKTDALKIKTDRPVHFHTDGDGRGISNDFEIKVVPACVNILY